LQGQVLAESTMKGSLVEQFESVLGVARPHLPQNLVGTVREREMERGEEEQRPGTLGWKRKRRKLEGTRR